MSFSSLSALVFKFFKAQPLGLRELVFQLAFFVVLLSLVFFLSAEEQREDKLKGLSLGFLLSTAYVWLFLLSAEAFFKRKRSALLFFLLKWALLLGSFIFFKPLFISPAPASVSSLAFFIGLSGGLSLIGLYIYAHLKKTQSH